MVCWAPIVTVPLDITTWPKAGIDHRIRKAPIRKHTFVHFIGMVLLPRPVPKLLINPDDTPVSWFLATKLRQLLISRIVGNRALHHMGGPWRFTPDRCWEIRFPPPISKCDGSSRPTPFSFGLSAINLERAGWQIGPRDRSGSQ